MGINARLNSPLLFGLEERKGLKLHKTLMASFFFGLVLFCAGDIIAKDKRAVLQEETADSDCGNNLHTQQQ